MPYDVFSVGVIVTSALLFFLASRASLSLTIRLACILFAALLIRADASWQFSLHQWDERYHALVAKNLIADPLTPTLYREAVLPADYQDWMSSHIWLHKPPGALWPMAASMAVFGVNEIALRLPSILFSTLSVWLTYLIGARLFGSRVGLLAAAFHAVNGFLVALAAGRRVADHVDTALIFWIELGIWFAVEYAETRRERWLAAAGVALGAALLTKSLPALLIVVVVYAIFVDRGTSLFALTRAAVLLAIGTAVWLPWMVYTRLAFPREAEWAWQYTLQHLVRPLESHDDRAFSYVMDMPEFFGELVWLPLAAGLVAAFRHARARSLIVWLLTTYVVFSSAPTRLGAFVMIAAPAIFLIEADFWWRLRDRAAAGAMKVAITVLLIALLLLPARYLLDPANVFERRDRSPAAAGALRRIDAVVKLDHGVIFNVPSPIETMFYSRLMAYRQLPTGDEVRDLNARHVPIVIYVPEGTPVIPAEWNVIRLTPDQLR